MVSFYIRFVKMEKKITEEKKEEEQVEEARCVVSL